MLSSSVYSLPKLLGGQYMLTSILRETADTVVYTATQKDMRREVVVETLRLKRMAAPFKVQAFLETARLQTRVGGKFIATVLELLYAEDTWHIARERIQSPPLDELLEAGERGSAASLCELMLTLIRNCIKYDMMGVDSAPFSLQNAHFMGLAFRLDNLVRAGKRDPQASRRDIQNAARELLPKIDHASPFAHDMEVLLNNILRYSHWTELVPLDIYAEFIRMQLLIMRG